MQSNCLSLVELSSFQLVLTVFKQIGNKENLRRIQRSDYFQGDQRETHFDLKYLKYEVNYSVKYEINYLVCGHISALGHQGGKRGVFICSSFKFLV
jgi:hypothetical protein